ncbi:MAG: mismatch repair protein MutT [Flavipsychrobacter sp.]|nr:mismatch repair protein MutT [Flavipsychrobacter sp.]
MKLRLLIILSIIGLAEYYSFIVVRSAVRNMSPVWRTTLTVVYFLLTTLSWMGLILFRQINWANVPHLLRNVYVAFVLGFVVGKILILLVMLVDDIRRLVTWLVSSLVYRNSPAGEQVVSIERSQFLKTTALVLGGLSLAGFTYGITNRYKYRVRKVKLKFASLPAAFKGLKVVQISDIHTGSFDNHSAVAHGIQRVMDQNADIILFTGDLVNNHSEEVDAKYQEIFSRLKAPMGVYSTLGNHDYGDYVQWPSAEAKVANLETLKGIHASMGWRLLMNEHVVLERGADKIALVGIENWSAKANFPKYGDMRKAYEGLKEKNIPFKILLSHDPSHWHAQVVPEYKDVNLMLSGHTHGMQFGVDSKWFKWSPVQYMYNEWAGIYTEGEQQLYVNRGFGFLGYPGRLGVLPEITVFEFV